MRQSRRVWLTMRMIVCTPRPSSPTSWAWTPCSSTSLEGSERVPSLSFRRWMRKPGSRGLEQEAGQPGGRLGEREEHVAGRIGAEPLVAADGVAPVAVGLGAGGVGAHVGAALLLGHGHARQSAVGVRGPGEPRFPLRRQVGALPQGGNRRVGHRHRAHHARVHLAPDGHQRAPDDMRSGLRVPPGQAVDLALDRLSQGPVPGGVELDLVDAVSVAVVGAQQRLVALGPLGVLQGLGAAGELARVAQAVQAPAAALPLERLAQRKVGLEDVVGVERRRLVGYVMRGRGREHEGEPPG